MSSSRILPRSVILAFVALAACDAGRLVILGTAPENNAVTGINQKFGIYLDDTKDNQAKLRVYVRIDRDDPIRCRLNRTPTNTIEKTVAEPIFHCPINGAKLRPGGHWAHYWVIDEDGNERDSSSVSFTHDPTPPELDARLSGTEGGLDLTWRAADVTDFAEITASVNGVRIFTSFSSVGKVLLDAALVPKNATVELKAYDQIGNVTRKELPVP